VWTSEIKTSTHKLTPKGWGVKHLSSLPLTITIASRVTRWLCNQYYELRPCLCTWRTDDFWVHLDLIHHAHFAQFHPGPNTTAVISLPLSFTFVTCIRGVRRRRTSPGASGGRNRSQGISILTHSCMLHLTAAMVSEPAVWSSRRWLFGRTLSTMSRYEPYPREHLNRTSPQSLIRQWT